MKPTVLSEKSQMTLDIKTIAIVIGMAVSVSSTYFTLKADIDENKKALEKGNWVSATEYNLKDELVRTTIMGNSKKLDAIEDKLNTIDERLYNLNK
jgi:hypothetical protein|tara:strand:- start:126 stop:413 length:288 start_codon:yes stop_codon:yes gene_type:complete